MGALDFDIVGPERFIVALVRLLRVVRVRRNERRNAHSVVHEQSDRSRPHGVQSSNRLMADWAVELHRTFLDLECIEFLHQVRLVDATFVVVVVVTVIVVAVVIAKAIRVVEKLLLRRLAEYQRRELVCCRRLSLFVPSQ